MRKLYHVEIHYDIYADNPEQAAEIAKTTADQRLRAFVEVFDDDEGGSVYTGYLDETDFMTCSGA